MAEDTADNTPEKLKSEDSGLRTPDSADAGASAAPTAPTAQAAAPAPEDQLAAAKRDAADNYDRYVRAVADLENFRRRATREKDEIRQYATARVLEDLFPILEAIALGIDAAKKPGADATHIVDGMNMVLTQLKTTLATHGLKEINPPAGEKFDPHQHEAISTQPHAEIAEGAIAQVFRIGYSLNGRMLRPAAVVVSSGTAAASADAEIPNPKIPSERSEKPDNSK